MRALMRERMRELGAIAADAPVAEPSVPLATSGVTAPIVGGLAPIVAPRKRQDVPPRDGQADHRRGRQGVPALPQPALHGVGHRAPGSRGRALRRPDVPGRTPCPARARAERRRHGPRHHAAAARHRPRPGAPNRRAAPARGRTPRVAAAVQGPAPPEREVPAGEGARPPRERVQRRGARPPAASSGAASPPRFAGTAAATRTSSSARRDATSCPSRWCAA